MGIILGHLALRKKLVTLSQLKKALAEQAELAASGTAHVRLGEILVKNGHLSEEQLAGLVEEQKRELSMAGGGEGSLGRLLVEQGAVSPDKVDECLRLQSEAAESGAKPVPRLGELLVSKGHVSPDAVARTLAVQYKTIARCASCGKRYNITKFDPTKGYHCKSCQGTLEPVSAVDTVRVDESARIPLAETVLGKEGRKEATPPQQSRLGKYTILRELGRGGMGVVYEALDRELKRRVALKMMLGNPSASPEETQVEEQRFVRESCLSAKLPKHPNIVAVYEAGVVDSRRYLSMEFVEGKPMSKWKREDAVPIRRQVEVIRDVALAVDHAHRHNVIHRDLKPENILVDAQGIPRVTDFGLAKSMGQNVSVSLTGTGVVMGTPAYMSPEQVQGLRTLDHRADIYALGVILYEALTGRHPFQGETAIEIFMKTVKKAVPPPSTVLKPGAPPFDHTIENICLKCLAKRPKDRYATAEGLAGDLTKWLDGKPVRVVVPRPHPLLPVRRSFGWVYAVATVILALIVYSFLAPGASSPLQDRDVARRVAETARQEAEKRARAREEDLQQQLDKLRRDKEKLERREKEARTEEERRALAEQRAEVERSERLAREDKGKNEERLRQDSSRVENPKGDGENKVVQVSRTGEVANATTPASGASSPLSSLWGLLTEHKANLAGKPAPLKLEAPLGESKAVIRSLSEKGVVLDVAFGGGSVAVTRKPEEIEADELKNLLALAGIDISSVMEEELAVLAGEREKVRRERAERAKSPAPQVERSGKVQTSPQRMTVWLDRGREIKMEFVKIPAGKFAMGSNEYPTEKPMHKVEMTESFYMAVTEVTQMQWDSVMGSNRSLFKGPDLPVDSVNWEDCKGLVRKLNEKCGDQAEGMEYALPTEAEWEYACRAGRTGTWFFGDQEAQLGEYAWYTETPPGDQTHPVARKKANAWGLYDMHGNVWEWCEDWHGAYEGEPTRNPQGPANGEHRVLRGGAWCDTAWYARSSFRNKFAPTYRSNGNGMRLVLRPSSGNVAVVVRHMDNAIPERVPGEGKEARKDGIGNAILNNQQGLSERQVKDLVHEYIACREDQERRAGILAILKTLKPVLPQRTLTSLLASAKIDPSKPAQEADEDKVLLFSEVIELAIKLKTPGVWKEAKKYIDTIAEDRITKLGFVTQEAGTLQCLLQRWAKADTGSVSFQFLQEGFVECPIDDIEVLAKFQPFLKGPDEVRKMAASKILCAQFDASLTTPDAILRNWNSLKTAFIQDSQSFTIAGVDLFASWPVNGIGTRQCGRNYRLVKGSTLSIGPFPDEAKSGGYSITLRILPAENGPSLTWGMTSRTGQTNCWVMNLEAGEWVVSTGTGEEFSLPAKMGSWQEISFRVFENIAPNAKHRYLVISVDGRGLLEGGTVTNSSSLTIEARDGRLVVGGAEFAKSLSPKLQDARVPGGSR